MTQLHFGRTVGVCTRHFPLSIFDQILPHYQLVLLIQPALMGMKKTENGKMFPEKPLMTQLMPIDKGSIFGRGVVAIQGVLNWFSILGFVCQAVNGGVTMVVNYRRTGVGI